MRLLYEQKDRYVFRYTNHLDFPPHLHDAVELVYLKAGKSLFMHGSEKTLLEAGDFFVSFPNQIHGYENSTDTQLYLLILPVKPYLAAYRKALTEKVPVRPYLKKGEWEPESIETLMRLALKDKETASEEVMQGYFQVLMGKLLGQLTLQDTDAGSDDALRTILLYINDHYTEPLTRQQIAKAVGYNESYVSHLFSQTLKTSLPDYIHSLRLSDATRLLTQTDQSVTRIALDLGFGSLRNFNRVFLKETGMTPTQYRGQ